MAHEINCDLGEECTWEHRDPDTSFVVELPAGIYYMGDPCYALLDSLYRGLLGGRTAPLIVGTPLGRMVVWSTGGDGVFSGAVDQLVSNFPNNWISLGVDSGKLSLIPLELATKYDPAHPEEACAAYRNGCYSQMCGHFTLDQPHKIRVEPNGNARSFFVGAEELLDLPNLDIVVEDELDEYDEAEENG